MQEIKNLNWSSVLKRPIMDKMGAAAVPFSD